MYFLDSIINSLNTIHLQTQANLSILLIVFLVPVGVFFLNLILGKRLLLLGIFPRHLMGLPGIIFAPLLHVDFNHLFFNAIPLVVLSNFLLIDYGLHNFLIISLWITLLSGIGIWCFGKSGLHVGASALVTGYWGLLVSNIYQQGGLTNIILGLISLYYFAGIFFGIFPSKRGVSWEGHLFGLLAGLAVGYFHWV